MIINLQMLQNKTNTLKTAYSLPSSRYYRSVKYKVSNNSVAKVQNLTQINLSHNKQVPNKTATNWRRPTSYSLCKQPKTKDITTAHYENVQEAKPSEMRMTYMQTWDSLLNPIQKLKEIQQKGKGNRVCLPSIIDFEPSNFTSLDPLFLPFEHIQNGIADLKKQLPQPKIQMSQIHHDMINFRQKIEKELEDTQAYGFRQFQRLRKMLRVDKVGFQQNVMKFKRNCKDLYQQDEAFKKNFQGTKPRLDKLQVQIFSNRPFELSRNPELDQQFPQKYF